MLKVSARKITGAFAGFGVPCVARPEEAQGIPNVATIAGLECVFANLVSVAISLAGIVLFVMLLVGGFRYLTSGGDPKAMEAAKGTLTHAIAGLVILLLAFVFIRFLAQVTGVQQLEQFRITR